MGNVLLGWNATPTETRFKNEVQDDFDIHGWSAGIIAQKHALNTTVVTRTATKLMNAAMKTSNPN